MFTQQPICGGHIALSLVCRRPMYEVNENLMQIRCSCRMLWQPPNSHSYLLIECNAFPGLGMRTVSGKLRTVQRCSSWLQFTSPLHFLVYAYKVGLRRVHHRIIVDDALAGRYRNSDIQAINRSWLYFQVGCLSDVCTAEGFSVDPILQ
jgi:hypothetical protein